MNLVFIAALVAVCGAAKLDRTYLPPASAKTAGGTAGSIQTPFSGNLVNDNTAFPKGSYTNDFQGVVVDAAAAGTRSGEGESGLGAPRISYGSTDSKVGDAAFRGTAAGFRPFPGSQNFNRQSDSQNGQRFDAPNGQIFEGQGQNLNGQSQNLAQGQGAETDGQTASSQVQPSAQGFQQNRGPNAQASSPFQGNRGASAQASAQFQGNRGGNSQASAQFQGNRPSERAQAAFDRTASILRYENEVGPESYHYAFETDNGISAEENGVATNGVQAQGGFSYTGDDGQIYTVTYTADEGGYQPRGDHLPTPPPIPDEILKSLAKNAQDEAAGLIDDGSYDAQKYNAGGDYAERDGANVGHNDRATPNFGKRPESDATASGTFINQNNQPFVGQTGQDDGSSDSLNVPSNAFGPSSNANRFGQPAQPTGSSSNNAFGPSASNGFEQSSQPIAPSSSDAFGPSNTFGQAAQPSRASATNGFRKPSQSNAPSGSGAFGPSKNFGPAAEPSRTPVSNAFGQSSQTNAPSANDNFGPSNNFGQPSRTPSSNGFGSRKEYLPPVSGFNQTERPQRPISANAQASAGLNGISQASGVASITQPQNNQGSEPSSTFGRPNSNRLEALAQSSLTKPFSGNNGFESSPDASNFAQGGQPTKPSQTFGSRNEYLPPSFGQNGRPQRPRPQSPIQSVDATAAPSFNAASQTPGAFPANADNQLSPTVESAFNTQAGPQSNGFQQRPQSFNNQFIQNRFPSIQGQQNEIPEKPEESQNGQVSNNFGAFNQRPTSQPSVELTTPLEFSEQPESNNADSAAQNGFGSDSPNKRPGFEVDANAQSSLTPSRPQNQAIGSQPQTELSTGQGPFAQTSFNVNKPSAQNGFEPNEPVDAQLAPSTARPSFGQPQEEDHSYYYKQPAKPFNTPSGSRFPGAPSGQFNRVTPQSAQSSAQFSAASPQNFQENSFQSQKELNRGSTRYPQPSLAPTAPTGSIDGQYQGTTVSSQYNGITQASISPFQSQGSTRFSRPTLTPAVPTLASQFNGITQATASSFASNAPFGTRPTFQQSFNQPQPQPSKPFGQPESEAEVSQGSSPDVPTQQYNGEIYEYNKPPQGLPSPAQKEPTTTPQRGQNFPTGSQAGPQFGAQGSNEQDLNMQQQPTRPTFGSRPQFGAQPTRPQFGSFSRPGASLQEQSAQDTKPQISAQSRPFAQSQEEERPNCCKSLDSKLESLRGSSQNAGAPAQNKFGNQLGSPNSNVGQGQFGSQFAAPTSETGSQGFAGQGEAFGGPRKPPSFDQETGYHY